ncbi:hypothetical protein SAMN05192583_1487 [Sphingomonas gellani]|uniref:DUF721 domain-containing protein n=2 Tax=Sphingomonas gellani TaxID=1166340 RepID=A0A1H8C714_9SPHN|nr:hypothetical protein SAMN05192583_1487 [Sphingomonas gellani]
MSKRVRAPSPTSATAEPVRQNRSRAVSELLPNVGGAAFRRFGFVQSAVVSRWAEIVGERLAAASVPESIRFPQGKKQDGTLTLVVRGAHAPMMQHVAPEIIERVNRFFGYAAVSRLQIRQGDVAAREPRRAAPSLRPVPAELGEGLKTIADPELRAVLESLAAGVAGPPRPLPRIS